MIDVTQKNPNPTKDQHFMVDQDMIRLICKTADIQKGESVIEVGGGAGALTEHLAKIATSLTVVEKDPYYVDVLKEKFANYENVQIVEGDALEIDYFPFDRIVANLPYTITEPLFVNFAKKGVLKVNPKDSKSSKLKSITLVLSQNSVRKMVAPIQIMDGKSRHVNSEFGIMGGICHTFLDVDIVTAIPSEAFFPEPAVTSFLVNFVPKKNKTTVDRIMAEILTDKKESNSTIGRIYNMLIVQGKVYNLSKYKQNKSSFSRFTSKVIENMNVYELTNSQLSQLFQDLIRNDTKIKGSRKQSHAMDSYEEYLRTGHTSDTDDFEEEEEKKIKTKSQKKAEDKYSYLFAEKRYNTLLNRGLEFINRNDLQELLAQ